MVTITSAGSRSMAAQVRASTSAVVSSIQWRSSQTTATGRSAASRLSIPTTSAMVRSRTAAGVTSSGIAMSCRPNSGAR